MFDNCFSVFFSRENKYGFRFLKQFFKKRNDEEIGKMTNIFLNKMKKVENARNIKFKKIIKKIST